MTLWRPLAQTRNGGEALTASPPLVVQFLRLWG